MKELCRAINAAFGVLQGWKAVEKLEVACPEAGARDWVVLSVKATKLFAKGVKVSQKVPTSALFTRLVSKGHPAIGASALKDLASLAKGLNTFHAAVRVVQFMKGLGRQPQEGKLHEGESIWKGYKFSKSILDILDPVVGKSGWAYARAGRGFLALKNTVGGIGVIVKGAMLSKELCIAALQQLAFSGASLPTGYWRNHVGMLVGRSHQSRPKRLSCTAITTESNLRNLLLVSVPYASLSNGGFFSLICLLESFAKETRSPIAKCLGDDNVSSIFCLAMPLPSSEILV